MRIIFFLVFLVAGDLSFAGDDICDALSPKLDYIYENRDRHDVYEKLDVVDVPDYKTLSKSVGTNILVQSTSLGSGGNSVSSWRKSLDSIEGFLDSMKVKRFSVDLNNSGEDDDVIQVSWGGAKASRIRYNYVVDKHYNIANPEFFRNGDVITVKGEIVVYKGTTYSLVEDGYSQWHLRVVSLGDDPMQSYGGYYQRRGVAPVCELVP